jgi:hypothetical protein
MAQWQRKSNTNEGPVYQAENVRQGEIILRKPWQRVLFIAGLAIPFILVFIGWLFIGSGG